MPADGGDVTPSVSGPASGVAVLQPRGLGTPSTPRLDPFGIQRRKLRRYLAPGQQWISPIGYYIGPFEAEHGLDAAERFFRQNTINDKPPQIHLTVTETGLGILPTRRRSSPIWLPYNIVATVELAPATKARAVAMIPATAAQYGAVIITTNNRRQARLTGTTVDRLSALLHALGATIVS